MSLTDEDKQWITALFHERDKLLLARIERVETALPALFDERDKLLLARIERVETALPALFDERDKLLLARIERVETALLTEFHKWASPLEMRMRTHSAALRAIDLEMESVSDRVKKLESPSDPQ